MTDLRQAVAKRQREANRYVVRAWIDGLTDAECYEIGRVNGAEITTYGDNLRAALRATLETETTDAEG